MTQTERKIITFLSDFGSADGYAGSVKGVLKQLAPPAEIIDISHELQPFNVPAAAFAILNYYRQYPQGTIHLAVVDPGVGSERAPVILQTEKYYFVGPDNGIFHFVQKNEAYTKYRILPQKLGVKENSATFHGRDIFAPAAAFLAGGGEIHKIAKEISLKDEANGSGDLFFKQSPGRMEIKAAHIDRFGNIITGLSKEEYSKYVKHIRHIQIKDKTIRQIDAFYARQPAGTLMALWNSLNLLEIAVNQGNAAGQLQFDLNRDKVYIYF